MIFTAQVELLSGEYRRGPAGVMQLRHLPAPDFLQLLWVRLEQTQKSSLSDGDQLSFGQDSGPSSKDIRLRVAAMRWMAGPTFVTTPHQLATFKFHAAEGCIWLIAPAEGIEVAIVENGRVPVLFQNGG